MIRFSKIFFLLITTCSLWVAAIFNSGCGIYKLADVSIPANIKTVRIQYIDNKARYINPQLSPAFTDKLRQKIVGQTKLTQVNNENADYDISGWISQYEVSTSAISAQKVSTNRLTVGVHLILVDRPNSSTKPPRDIDVSRSFEFSATLSLAQAEAQLKDEIIRNLTDEVFNRIFSDW